MMTRDPKRDLFLCHSGADRKRIVRPLADLLESHGVTAWVDEAEILLGDSITQRINEGLANSRFVVAFISRSFLRRRWPQAELRSALASSIAGRGKIIPVLVDIKPETLFKRYPLLQDIRCASTKPGLKPLAEQLRQVIGRASKVEPSGKITRLPLSLREVVQSVRTKGLEPNRWLRLKDREASEGASPLAARTGFEQLREKLRAQGCHVSIDWATAPSPEKRYTAGILLAVVDAYGDGKIKGYDKHLTERDGIHIHAFDRPAYSRKDPTALAVKAASGCILDDEWFVLLNVPAFFDAGWRDELSMAPLAIGQEGFGSHFTPSEGVFHPFIPYGLRPSLVLAPCLGLSKALRKRLRRFKYGGDFPRMALCPNRFPKTDAEFLHNNGFLVVDQVTHATQAIPVLREALASSGILGERAEARDTRD